MTVEYTIQTNGTLIDDELAALFKEHDYLVGISIDGPPDDARRLPRGPRRRADLGPRAARSRDAQEARRRVQHADHAPPRERRPPARGLPLPARRARLALSSSSSRSSSGCRRRGSTCARPDRAVARARPRGAVALLARPAALPPGGRARHRPLGHRRAVRRASSSRSSTSGSAGTSGRSTSRCSTSRWPTGTASRAALCVFQPTCGGALAMEHNGDVYSCDHFVEEGYKLGNITETPMAELVASPAQRKFGQDKLDTLPQFCLDCDVRFACHGACPKDRFIRTPDGEPGLNYLCAGYKAFFHHVDEPMRAMSDAAPPGPGAVRADGRLRGARRGAPGGGREGRAERPLPVRQRPQGQALPRSDRGWPCLRLSGAAPATRRTCRSTPASASPRPRARGRRTARR